MSRTPAERATDVRTILAAARGIVERRASLAHAIVESTALSPEGVELAFTKSLETDATDSELGLFVARAGDTSRVSVILSANVFVGALRAVALARAAAPKVVVRPSKREPMFARALVDAIGDPAIVIDAGFDVASQHEGEIHVYGRDETIADVKKHAKVKVRGHGSGMGVAWISDHADLGAAARLLAEDVVLFDQRGCLSPRIALVAGDDARASDFADALHAELERLEGVVPRGAIPTEERAASDRYVATMTYACRALVGEHAIGVAPAGAPLVLPPAYRHVHVAPCASPRDAVRLLEPLAKGVVAVGSDDLAVGKTITPTWARLSPLGRMQRPPLDGPVDLRDA